MGGTKEKSSADYRRGQQIYFFSKAPMSVSDPSQNPSSLGTGDTLPGVKRQKRESGYSSPSSAELKNDWSSPIRLYGVYEDSPASI
jgi:hypothetical protein